MNGQFNLSEALEQIKASAKIKVQLCIVHQIRNSLKYVASKNQKEFMNDLKLVYQAISREAAVLELDRFEERWGSKYPIVIQSWRNKRGEFFYLF